MIKAIILGVFSLTVCCISLSVHGQETPAPPNSILVTAKTAEFIAEVQGKKTEKASFTPEMQRIFKIVSNTKLWSHYRYAVASKADIIIKIIEDRTFVGSETVSLKVLDPDDNKEIYNETRELVEVSNDVTRLVSHFIAAVEEDKYQYGLAQERMERQARLSGKKVSKIVCAETVMYANRGSDRKIGRVLHKGDSVAVLMTAGNEVVVKVGESVGYVDATCVED